MCNLTRENVSPVTIINPDVNGLLIPVEGEFFDVLFDDIDAGVGELWVKKDNTQNK